jgi:very-short-patch-repair endonuclease
MVAPKNSKGVFKVRYACPKCRWKLLEIRDPESGRVVGRRKAKRLQSYARQNRRKPTAACVAFFKHLQRAKIRFMSEYPIPPFIADFVLKDRKIIIEIDGGYHDEPKQQEKDRARTLILNSKGYTVYRLRNEEVGTQVMYDLFKHLKVGQTCAARVLK